MATTTFVYANIHGITSKLNGGKVNKLAFSLGEKRRKPQKS